MTKADRLRDRAACPICGGKDFATGHLQETHEYAAIRFKTETDGTFLQRLKGSLSAGTKVEACACETCGYLMTFLALED